MTGVGPEATLYAWGHRWCGRTVPASIRTVANAAVSREYPYPQAARRDPNPRLVARSGKRTAQGPAGIPRSDAPTRVRMERPTSSASNSTPKTSATPSLECKSQCIRRPFAPKGDCAITTGGSKSDGLGFRRLKCEIHRAIADGTGTMAESTRNRHHLAWTKF